MQVLECVMKIRSLVFRQIVSINSHSVPTLIDRHLMTKSFRLSNLTIIILIYVCLGMLAPIVIDKKSGVCWVDDRPIYKGVTGRRLTHERDRLGGL